MISFNPFILAGGRRIERYGVNVIGATGKVNSGGSGRPVSSREAQPVAIKVVTVAPQVLGLGGIHGYGINLVCIPGFLGTIVVDHNVVNCGGIIGKGPDAFVGYY